jgi:hypothetical protein
MESLEESVAANSRAVRLCCDHGLTLKAPQVAYRETLNDDLLPPLGIVELSRDEHEAGARAAAVRRQVASDFERIDAILRRGYHR